MLSAHGPELRGAVFSLIAFTLLACGDAFTKTAGLGGVPVPVILCLSSWAAVLVLGGTFWATGRLPKLKPASLKTQLIRLALFLASSVVNVIAFTNLPLTTVYIALFASPFVLSLLGARFMGEPIGREQIFATILGFVGVVLALVPMGLGESTGPGNPLWGALALPVFFVLYIANMLWLRVCGKTETAESTTFLPFLARGIVFLPALFLTDLSAFPWPLLACVVGMGFLFSLGVLFQALSYKLAPVAIVAPFHYTQLLTGALLGYLIWDMVPSVWLWIGGALIVSSGLMIALQARKKSLIATAAQEG